MKSAGETRPIDAKLLPNGNVAWLHFNAAGSEEHSLDGTLVRTPNGTSNVDHHEIQLLPNGNYSMGSYVTRRDVSLEACGGTASVVDNEIQEVSPTGEIVWSWKALDHISVEESVQWPDLCTGEEVRDIFHFNSIEADGDAFVVSFRHLNAVYKLSRTTGEIIWKLGGTQREESLAVINDPIVDGGDLVFGGQHDARLLPDGTWTVHDNRTWRPNAVPRAMRFEIDEEARTARVVEIVHDPDAPTSGCCGSARKLNTGNWVMAWGGLPAVTELTPSGELVFRINFENLFTYRAAPIMPGVLSRTALLQGMDAQYPRTRGTMNDGNGLDWSGPDQAVETSDESAIPGERANLLD